MLHKEMKDLVRAVKKNLKVTDMPERDSDSDDEEDFEELASTLKIEFTKEGLKNIEKAVRSTRSPKKNL